MTSLFIFFVHGNVSDLKILTKSTLQTESVITLSVYYDLNTRVISISGSPVVIDYMAKQETWFHAVADDELAFFKQLFEQLMSEYHFESNKIYTSFEGNWSLQSSGFLAPLVLDAINYTRPGTTILPVGTIECCKFIHYWMGYYGYPNLNLGDDFIIPKDYYRTDEMTDKKMAELEIVKRMPLTCVPPLMATFDKSRAVQAIRIFLARIAIEALSTKLSMELENISLSGSRRHDEADVVMDAPKTPDVMGDDNNVYYLLSPADSPIEEDNYEEKSLEDKDNIERLTVSKDDFFIHASSDDSVTTVWMRHTIRKEHVVVTSTHSFQGVSHIPPSLGKMGTQSHLVERPKPMTPPHLPAKQNSWLRFFYCCCGSETDVLSTDDRMELGNDARIGNQIGSVS